MSWLLETLLGLVLAGLTVAGAYEAWQNRRSSAALLQGSIAVGACIAGLTFFSTWPWRLVVSILNWLTSWLVPHLANWMFDVVEFLILTVLVEAVTLLWHLLIDFVTCWYAFPLIAVSSFCFVCLRFTQERDRQRLRNIATTGAPGQFDWNEAFRQVFSPVLNIL